MPRQSIDAQLCTRCGQCVRVCPYYVYEPAKGAVRVNLEMSPHCFMCGHCMAVCPTGAVAVNGLDYAAFEALPEEIASPQALRALMLQRRSVRAFKQDPVPRELIEQVLQAAATAPMGFPPSGVQVAVLASREHVQQVAGATARMVGDMQKMTHSRLGRLIFKRVAGARMFEVLNRYLMPILPTAMKRHSEQGEDFATCGAPALLVFHVAPTSASDTTEVVLAATYAMLMAQALGLGSIMLGLAAAAFGRDASLKERLGIPSPNEVRNVLALGYPDRQFVRTIPRELGKVTWVE